MNSFCINTARTKTVNTFTLRISVPELLIAELFYFHTQFGSCTILHIVRLNIAWLKNVVNVCLFICSVCPVPLPSYDNAEISFGDDQSNYFNNHVLNYTCNDNFVPADNQSIECICDTTTDPSNPYWACSSGDLAGACRRESVTGIFYQVWITRQILIQRKIKKNNWEIFFYIYYFSIGIYFRTSWFCFAYAYFTIFKKPSFFAS